MFNDSTKRPFKRQIHELSKEEESLQYYSDMGALFMKEINPFHANIVIKILIEVLIDMRALFTKEISHFYENILSLF